MTLFKLYCHILTIIWKLYYRVIYGNHLNMGANFQFRKGFSLLLDAGGKVRVGDYVFFNNYCTVCAQKEISIGDGSVFGENVKIYDHNHIYSDPNVLIKHQGYSSAPIHIGKHCWIGSNVTILKGVTIGDNCVIGAGCVVYKDVPAGTILINKQELVIKKINSFKDERNVCQR